MHLTASTCLAALFDFSLPPHMIAIVVPVAGLIFAAVMALGAMHFQNKRRQMWHETARVALEKGQPLPPGMDEPARPPRRHADEPSNDFRAGLILIATGMGLWLFLGMFIDQRLGYVGAIPGFIGVALLIYGALRLIFGRRNPTKDDLPNA